MLFLQNLEGEVVETMSEDVSMCPTHLRRRCLIFLIMLRLTKIGIVSYGIVLPVMWDSIRLLTSLVASIVSSVSGVLSN